MYKDYIKRYKNFTKFCYYLISTQMRLIITIHLLYFSKRVKKKGRLGKEIELSREPG